MALETLPKNLRISTITATSKINSSINIERMYNILQINDNILYIEYGNEKNKGVSQKHISDKKRTKKKVFFNQITLEVMYDNVINNIKFFNNGSISITGIKNISFGKIAIYNLFTFLLKTDKSIFNIINPVILFFNIVLINSDFKLDFEIKRSELHQILAQKYKFYSSYEPCIYPGVNSKYFWNKKYTNKTYYVKEFSIHENVVILIYNIKNVDIPLQLKEELYTFKNIYCTQISNYIKYDIEFHKFKVDVSGEYMCFKIEIDPFFVTEIFKQNIENNYKEFNIILKYNYKGVCYCDGECNGKGSGNGETECKKVTISSFQSGSIIITGANNKTQIIDSYNFITTIINDHIDVVKKTTMSQKKKDEIIYIKKSNINI